jgi:hypothetical protein
VLSAKETLHTAEQIPGKRPRPLPQYPKRGMNFKKSKESEERRNKGHGTTGVNAQFRE